MQVYDFDTVLHSNTEIIQEKLAKRKVYKILKKLKYLLVVEYDVGGPYFCGWYPNLCHSSKFIWFPFKQNIPPGLLLTIYLGHWACALVHDFLLFSNF